MKADFYDALDAKMLFKQRALFRAFFINVILGLIIGALALFVPYFLFALVVLTGISPMMMFFSVVSGIALWQMLGILFFLVPALAIWWQRHSCNEK
mgnify:CR=1 FL=1